MIKPELIRKDTMQIIPAKLTPYHGFFLFDELPPPNPTNWPEFAYRKKVKPGKITDTCWGTCRNGVPIDLPAIEDYFGFAIVDKDRATIVHGYYTTKKIPAYEWVPWYTKDDVVMPKRDWNLICYVGYYDPKGDILHQTDWREFTIKSGAKFPWWLLLIPLAAAIPLLWKLKNGERK